MPHQPESGAYGGGPGNRQGLAPIRFTASDGTRCVGSDLLTNGQAVLTPEDVGGGSDHQVDCKGALTRVTRVVRTGPPDIDLAILRLKRPRRA
jgi:hypothetical protein